MQRYNFIIKKNSNIMEKFLSSHYNFRINLLRKTTEYAEAGSRDFRPLDSLALNTVYWHLRREKIPVRFHELECYLYSSFLPQYHPFRAYMDALPAWDGRDRLTPLARRVSRDALWGLVFHIWMRGLTAQWLGHPMQAANSMVPVLMSERQGLRKSTFCRMLMPPELQSYYLDKLDFTQAGEYDRMMAQFGLINLDELDRYSPAAMARFKAATQMTDIMGHSTRTAVISRSPRLASFIATTNVRRILRDRTGSRRFFCQEVERVIPCHPFNHAQLYAQLRAEVVNGERTWFNKQEEARIGQHNAPYYALTAVQEAVLRHFRPTSPGEGLPTLSSRAIFDTLSSAHPTLLQGLRICDFGKQLHALFPMTSRHRDGYRFHAAPLTSAT